MEATKKKSHMGTSEDEKGEVDHAGSLIASIVIDPATKSSAKFKYTYEYTTVPGVLGLPFRCTVYFRAVLTDGTCSYRSCTTLPQFGVQSAYRVSRKSHRTRRGTLSKFLGNFVSRDFVGCRSN